MPRFWRKKALQVKAETVYGQDSTPGATDAMLATNVNLRPLEGRTVNRGLDRPFLGAQGEIEVGSHVALDFEVEMAGGGAADTPPPYRDNLLAGGFAETVNVGTSVVYDPVSDSFSSNTIALNIDGILHKLLGARCNVAARMPVQDIPRWRFSYLGLLVAPADAALPAVDTSDFQFPLHVSDANTPTLSLHGYAGVVEAFELDLRNQVEGRFLVGSESIRLVDRNVGGSITLESDALATFDPFGRAISPKTQGALQLIHGTAAGNTIQIDAPVTELGRTTYGQSQGIAMWTTPFVALPSDAGNDDIQITFT